ncbi:hypothetical protein DID76_03940 [Candidatus Marinamargulisbacteria bacterium SCGC AG-414-C22]|nr:hypothetical protein DID76_03940 [Candidatus Marinamargulisbacteria bacterium SCGC AG-414-C22]
MGQVKDNVKKTVSNVWSADCQSYNLFSMLLERQILTAEHIDLSFTPIEYLEQITACQENEDGEGYLNLLVMLFTEHFQKKVTGQKQLKLPEAKYNVMAKQFMFFCKLELFRRQAKVQTIAIEHLFDPNVKTRILIHASQVFPELNQTALDLSIHLIYQTA